MQKEKKKSDSSEIVKGKWEYKSEEQKSAIKILKLFMNHKLSNYQATKFFNDYFKIVSMAKYRSIHKEGLKISTSKQML